MMNLSSPSQGREFLRVYGNHSLFPIPLIDEPRVMHPYRGRPSGWSSNSLSQLTKKLDEPETARLANFLIPVPLVSLLGQP